MHVIIINTMEITIVITYEVNFVASLNTFLYAGNGLI